MTESATFPFIGHREGSASMRGIQKAWRRAGIGLVLGLLAATAQAEAPFTGPLPKVWQADWGLGDTQDYFGAALMEGVAGRCDELLELTSKPHRIEWARMEALGEMYDRGICVPFDPAAALRAFERGAEISTVGKSPVIPWKYLYGHGIPADAAKASELFKAFVIRMSSSSLPLTLKNPTTLIDRQPPRQLEDGLAWLLVMKQNNKRMFELGRNLLEGSGVYYDGTPLPRDRKTAFEILSSMEGVPEANYLAGSEAVKGTFEGAGVVNLKEFAHGALANAADCRHLDAMILYARQLEQGSRLIGKSESKAYDYYRAAQALGADVKADLRRLERRLSIAERASDFMVEYILKPKDRCFVRSL